MPPPPFSQSPITRALSLTVETRKFSRLSYAGSTVPSQLEGKHELICDF